MRQPPGPREDGGDGIGGGLLALLVLPVVASDGAVRGLGLHRLAVGANQDTEMDATLASAALKRLVTPRVRALKRCINVPRYKMWKLHVKPDQKQQREMALPN